MKNRSPRRLSGFTLVEILVVLGIIALLGAILFPAFARARESARQTNCASNLNQIYFAVQQYFQDERAYPDSLVDLLPEGSPFDNGVRPFPDPAPTIDANAVGYLKSTAILRCQNDDTEGEIPHSSYGVLAKFNATTIDETQPWLYTWNYWGYNEKGLAFPAPPTGIPNALTRKGDAPYDAEENPIDFSLSNRFASPQTIITHCVWHRVQTAADLDNPQGLTDGSVDASKKQLARDIVLRLDGSARVLDVSQWQTKDLWRNHGSN